MSKKPNVVAAYGDPKKDKNWPHMKIRQEFVSQMPLAGSKSNESPVVQSIQTTPETWPFTYAST
jgi:hypothetical protein